ncbi:MAG: HAD family hydrolase [Rhodospirillum sp.]|nr:HAD family hydrolase [Rhodospirillum sp.]MCF8487730.1 HAD family hydrolase [Rhodospirillum sp.]MCF8500392.1 HAD family hydrolase [Rhodospirillum sp.]
MTINPSPPKAILFDWDNTLVDSWPCIHKAMNTTLVAMDHPTWTFEETRARVALSMRDAFPTLFGDRWEEARDVFFGAFKEIHLEMLVALDGAWTMLETLAARGIYLGVVSNKTGPYLREEADALGWRGLFGALVGAGDAQRDKPAPDPVHMALVPAGLTPGPDVWFVGDTHVDLACAKASGCTAILSRSDPPAQGEFADCFPAHYVAGCVDVIGLLPEK